MILVDSSVWIAAFRDPAGRIFHQLDGIVEDQVCTCGVVIQEVLQGLHDPHLLWELDLRMSLLAYLETARETHHAAAELFRHCRRRGIAVHTIDALIMAIAVERRVPVWTLDGDFVRAASIERRLKLYKRL